MCTISKWISGQSPDVKILLYVKNTRRERDPGAVYYMGTSTVRGSYTYIRIIYIEDDGTVRGIAVARGRRAQKCLSFTDKSP